MYSNNIVNFQESTTIFKCLYKSGNLLKAIVSSYNFRLLLMHMLIRSADVVLDFHPEIK